MGNRHKIKAMRDDKFYFAMSLLIAIVVLIGFAPSFYFRGFTDRDSVQFSFIIHGILNSLWVFAFIYQCWLVLTNRQNYHKRMGMVWGLMAPLIIFMNLHTIYVVAQRPENLNSTEIWVMGPIIGNLLGVIAISAYLAFGLYFRNKPKIHKRLMLLATISMLGPALDRLHLHYEFLKISDDWAVNSRFYVFGGFLVLYILILLHDIYSLKKPHFINIIALTWFLISGKVFYYIVDSGLGTGIIKLLQRL